MPDCAPRAVNAVGALSGILRSLAFCALRHFALFGISRRYCSALFGISRRYCWRSLAVIVGTVFTAVPVFAQTVYRLVGTVSATDGHVVSGAEVSIVERDTVVRLARSDSAGRFIFEGLTTPGLTLRVRRLGYEPQQLSVHLTKSGRTANISVTLVPSVASLDTVVVEDTIKTARPNPRLVAFNERRATNSFGQYVTEEMLAKLRPHHASEALQTVSGVILRPAKFGNLVRLRGCGVRGQSFERVGPLVWLDGVRLPGAEIDEVTQGVDIAGIEVYNSFAGVPAQYFDRTAVCGTILVWTKHR
jgi:hypothetical protein